MVGAWASPWLGCGRYSQHLTPGHCSHPIVYSPTCAFVSYLWLLKKKKNVCSLCGVADNIMDVYHGHRPFPGGIKETAAAAPGFSGVASLIRSQRRWGRGGESPSDWPPGLRRRCQKWLRQFPQARGDEQFRAG